MVLVRGDNRQEGQSPNSKVGVNIGSNPDFVCLKSTGTVTIHRYVGTGTYLTYFVATVPVATN